MSTAAAVSGTFRVGEDGDYQFDDGLRNLKKRILRRLVTKKGGFAFLPDYGVGALEAVKKLNMAATRQMIADEAQRQIAREPDVEAVSVRAVQRSIGVVVFVTLVRTTSGAGVKVELPVEIG